MYSQLVPIIAPVLVGVLVGFGWQRLRLPFDRDFLTQLVMFVGVPCLILDGITGLTTPPATFLSMVGYAIVVLATCGVVGAVALRVLGQPLRSYLPPVAFGNSGNLGLPLCLFAFGSEGLGLAIGFYLVGSVTQFLIGPLFQGRQPVWRTLLTTPVNYAAITGLALLATGTKLPLWVGNSISLLAGMAIPLMLVALGHALGSFGVQRLPVAAGIATARLGLGFAAGYVLTLVLGLEGTARGVVIIESAMPVAVFNYLLAARYDRHPGDVAGAILLSTLLSFATLPLLLLVALPG
ncbi:MAG: AEC family transporter [Chromatiales bacterium]|nr:AEC family transporter [Chromatiales bacterium]